MDFTRSPEDNTSVIRMVDEFRSFLGHGTTQRPKRKLNSSNTSAAGSFLSDISSSAPPKKLSINEEYTTLTRNEKADLIVAKSKVSKLEEEVHCLKNEKKLKDIETENLKKQNSLGLLKMQEECDSLRRKFKNVYELKQGTDEELQEITKKYQTLKDTYNLNTKNWEREKKQLVMKLQQLDAESRDQISKLKTTQLRQAEQMELYKSKFEESDLQLSTYSIRQKENSSILKEFTDVKLRCEYAENKVKQLEEKDSRMSESYSIIQNNQSELLKFRELTKENKRLKEDNQLYRDSADNSSILKEKNATLEGQLKRAKEVIESLNKLEFENKALKSKLQKWESSDELGGAVKPRSPGEMTRIIAKLQETQYSLVEKQGELNASVIIKDSMYEDKNDECTRLHSVSRDLQTRNEELEDKYQKLQRRFTLVSADRDGLRRVLSSFENGTPAPEREQLKEAKNTVEANLKQIGQLEDELRSAKQDASTQKTLYLQLQLDFEKFKNASLESPAILREKLQVEEARKKELHKTLTLKIRKEVEAMKTDMNKLKEEKQILEIRLKRKECQGDFDPSRTRILHMPNNPAQLAREKYLRDLDSVHEENDKLRKKLLKLQAENQEMMDESMNVSKLIKTSKTMEDVTKKLEAEKKSKARLMEEKGTSQDVDVKNQEFSKKAKNFREAVYHLLGYSLKETSADTYRLQSIYSEKPDDFFMFKNFTSVLIRKKMSQYVDVKVQCSKDQSGSHTGMIETAYAREWIDSINDYLQKGDSIPGLLATVTLELFSRQSEIQDMTLANKAKQL